DSRLPRAWGGGGVSAETGSASFCASWGVAGGRVVRVRLGWRRMAHSGGEDEDERAAHRASFTAGGGDSAGGSSAYESRTICVSVAADARPADVGEHDKCRTSTAWV